MEDRMIRLDSLFCAVRDVDLPGGLKGLARALSDAETKELRRYALLKSQEVTKELEDETSAMHQAYMVPLAITKDRDLLFDTIQQVRRIELLRDAAVMYPNVLIPMPDDATDIQERDVLTKRDEQEETVRQQREAHLTKRMAEIRKKLKTLNLRQLRKMARDMAITVAERATMIDAMRWYTVYAGVHVYQEDGETKRLFSSPDAASKSPEQVVSRLYAEVDVVNTVDPWGIAKNVSTDSGTASLPSS